ncbi:MAG TPA: efflux RND transporter periplasmic adaptor subunit [Catalimonadaceae bacterium]|nr:efflux RND transporter periplasmic adaptor subunit [Catalimonadaceae bacterium]HPI10291.1 efflux RND transporter periplasmic adaptor subunit [Catalimonadaceae bacterium]
MKQNLNTSLSVFLILSVLFFAGCGKKREQTKPRLSDISESVYASARIKALDQYTIFPSMNGTLKEVKVEAGDTVAENQDLFRLDDLASKLNSENARLALQLAEENAQKGSEKRKELEIALNLAKEKYKLDSDLLKRQKNLWSQGVGSKAELDQKELAAENSKSNLESALNRLEQINTQLTNDLQKARNNFQISQKQNGDFMIRSVHKGRVFDVLKKTGEVVSPQTPLAIIGDAGSFVIEMEVDQTDITRIQHGQLVTLTMDSYRNQVFEATVTKIYPIMDERSRTFKVEALFKQTPPALYPNLTAEANIIILQKSKSLTIPRNYLVDGKYVLVGKDEKKEVKTGLKDYQKVEILSGIDSSTVLFKP